MTPTQERPPVTEERRLAVAGWIQSSLHPVERLLTESEQETDTEAESFQQWEQEFEVREYQLDAWANLWDARQEGQKRALVSLATGLGKTSVAVFDVMKFREECAAQDPPMRPRILFVSHMNDIGDQARQRFEHFMPDLDMTTFQTQQQGLPDADITFATFQSLHSELNRFDPQDFEYIIYDEAHHSEAKTFKEVRDHFDPLFELALTATPDRLDGQDIRDYFGEAVYSKCLPDAIAEGWLANVDYHIVFDDILKQLMQEGFEPSTLKEFHDLFKVKPRNEIIAQNIIDERHKIGLDSAKTIVFCEDVSHAEEMAELLGGVAYHSGVRDENRPRILEDFRQGNSQVICTVDMFNEGIDIPDTRIAVFLRSTQSENIFLQQLGRGLRRAPGKDTVTVLDFVANIERITMVRELSKSIQRRSKELMQDNLSKAAKDPGDEAESEETRLNIHTPHGDFDFDRMAVDLLMKYDILRSPVAPMSSDEEISVAAFSRMIGRTPGTVFKIIRNHSIATVLRKFGSRVGEALTPEARAELLALPESVVQVAEEGDMSLNVFALSRGVPHQTVKKYAKENDIPICIRKIGNSVSMALTADAQHSLMQLPEMQVRQKNEEETSVSQIARGIGMALPTAYRLIEMNGIETIPRKHGPNTTQVLNTEAVKQFMALAEVQTPAASDNEISIRVAAKSLRLSEAKIRELLEENDLPIIRRKFGARIADGISEENRLLLEAILGDSLYPLQDDEISLIDAAAEIGVSYNTLKKRIAQYDINIIKRRAKRSSINAIKRDDLISLNNNH